MKKWQKMAVVFLGMFLTLLALTFDCRAETEISDSIHTDTSWTLAGSPYRVRNTIDISSDTGTVTLRIEAGVMVVFDDLRGIARMNLDFRRNAALEVYGTESAPVLFTSVVADKTEIQVYNGIYFHPDSRASDSVIQWAEFEQAGSAVEIHAGAPTISNTVFKYCNTGVYIESPDSDASSIVNPTIADCVFQHQREYGVHVKNAAAHINGCRFENNGSWRDWNGHWVPDVGGAMAFENSDPILKNNTAPAYNAVSGNNQFATFIGNNFNINADWEIPGTLDGGAIFPYFIRGSFAFSNADNLIQLTIDPGVKLMFNDLRGVSHCRIDIGENAALTMRGTADKPILCTSVEPDKTQANVWSIRFLDGSRASESVIDQVIFEQPSNGVEIYTGTPLIQNAQFRSYWNGLYIDGGSQPDITDCSFINGGHAGVHAVNPGLDIVISGCIFKNNQEYSIRNDTDVCIDARHNYWGNSTGPFDGSDALDCVYNLGYRYHNPNGLGDAVTDSVIYDPWSRSQAPCDCPDGDSDGVPDALDDCPTTLADSFVDRYGCSRTVTCDVDHDGKTGLAEIIHHLQMLAGMEN